MKASNWTILAALLAISSTSFAGVTGNVSLTHFEIAEEITLRAMSQGAANGDARMLPATTLEMRFDALGRSFDLALEPNSRITAPRPGIDVYRGEISGVPGSWVRIVMHEGMPSGLIYDGNELIAIEAPGDSLVPSAAPIVYRLADAIVAPGSMSCGSHAFMQSGAQAYEALVGELGQAQAAQGPGAISEIEVGAMGDNLFTLAKGGDAGAAAAITTRLNNVDGIFSAQLGVQISVPVIETFDATNDPLSGTTVAGDLLDEVSNYRSLTPAQNSNGLTHLYTGRDLNGSTVGIAWSGALCSNFFGAGLSEGNGTATFDSLIAAHEIGHNFGAPHDGEAGSPCESQAGQWLMSPQLNGSDQFSQCSIDEMSDDIAAASCITPLPAVDMEVSLASSTTVLFGADAILNYDLTNNGAANAANVVVDVTLPANVSFNSATPSAGSCTSGAGTVSCALGDVPGLSGRTVDISVTPTIVGSGNLSASVITTDTDERPGNNNETVQIDVDPAVDLVVTAPNLSSIDVSESTTVVTSLDNIATIDATVVTLTIDLGAALQATAASWSLGTCSIQGQQVTCQATDFLATSSATVSVTATGVSVGNPNITVSLASFEADLVPADNTATFRLRVNDPNDKDSGGGATGPLLLLALAMTGLLRRRRH